MIKFDDWYEYDTLGDGVSLIRETQHDPEWRCNIWHVHGRDRDLLIDTGLGLRPLAPILATMTDRPVTAVCTHCHYDHAGGMCQFDDRIAHVAEAEAYEHPTRHNIVADDFFVDAMVWQSPYPDFAAETWCMKPAPLTGHVDDGDLIDLGDRVFQVLHVPGHSPGSISLWEPETGILFTGDTIYDGGLIDDLYHSVPTQLIESHQRLLELPASTIHGGHYASFGHDKMLEIAAEYASGQRRWGCPVPSGD